MSSENLTQLRRHLHSIAEVSGKENNTADFIINALKSHKPEKIITGLGGHGVLARFGGKKGGPVILIRCELDALPIAEENDFDYVSQNESTGHKCGHDGHMAILCGVAEWLVQNDSLKGDVLLLFQPAEETGEGAKKVLKDEKFKHIKPDFVFALHNIPGYEKHQIIIKEGAFAAASAGFIARFKGETSHAAHPEQGRSPAQAVAQLIQALSSLPQYSVPFEKRAKVTVVQSRLGKQSFGISPGYGEVMATLRTYDDELLKIVKTKATELTAGIAKTYNLDWATEQAESFSVTKNDKNVVKMIRSAAAENDLDIIEKESAFSWSEDFGHFAQKFKGAMFGLGSGRDQPALHAADYDFPDEIIATGVNMFTGIVEQISNEE